MHSHRVYGALIYSYRPKDVSTDLADEVHVSPLRTGFVFLTFVLDRLLHITKLLTRRLIATNWPKSEMYS